MAGKQAPAAGVLDECVGELKLRIERFPAFVSLNHFDEKLTAFMELEAAVRAYRELS